MILCQIAERRGVLVESKEHDLILGLQTIERPQCGAARLPEARCNTGAAIDDQGDGQRQLMAKKMGDLPCDPIVINDKVFRLKPANDIPTTTADDSIDSD
jgi:hypothetical protein